MLFDLVLGAVVGKFSIVNEGRLSEPITSANMERVEKWFRSIGFREYFFTYFWEKIKGKSFSR